MDSAIVHYRLGLCFMDMAMDFEAAQCFRTAISLDDGATRALALSLVVQTNRQACEWTQDAADTRALLEAVDRDDPETARLLLPFALISIESTPQQQRRLGERRVAGLTSAIVPLPAPGPRRPGRIRVGYLSSDFYHHATAVLMTELLERRDTSRFETFLYSHSRDDDSEIGRRVRAACEHYVDIRDTGNCAVAQRIRADGIDILIDLKGHTRDSRMELMAYRPAPVQAAYLGYPATTGAPFIDYMIGDRVTTPLAHAAHYTEQIAQLDGCYQPNDAARPLPPCPSRAELGLPDDAVVLCCFNQTYKLSPHMLDLWSRILADAPRTVLWMLAWNPHARENLLRELAARGVAPSACSSPPSWTSPATSRACARPTCSSTPGPATRTPPPARRCGPACPCSPCRARPSRRASRPASSRPAAWATWPAAPRPTTSSSPPRWPTSPTRCTASRPTSR
jgi:predicted O-linked N-acetylglucosamine transferase (SPINDLY family)